ncbi:hypothetical protein D3C73_1416070 [compost metagenome]
MLILYPGRFNVAARIAVGNNGIVCFTANQVFDLIFRHHINLVPVDDKTLRKHKRSAQMANVFATN